MPELPEVETVRRVLKGWIVGKKVINITSQYPNILANTSIDELNKTLNNKVISDVKRYGKFLMICFDDIVLLSHLRMEGKYYLGHYKNSNCNEGVEYDPDSKTDKMTKHTHLVFEFEDQTILLYHDVRKFGRFHLTNTKECFKKQPLSLLGKEPFVLENGDSLYEKTRKIKKTIKETLLDQSLLVGLGNIYVDEVCFLSKLSPHTPASEVSKDKWDEIVKNSVIVLNKAIELGGSTVRSYHFAGDVDGKFQNELNVYGREGLPCVICNTPITKTKIGGRGTHFCSHCQRKKEQKDIKVIGITGLIASGKSTVSKLFVEHGYQLIDADKIARNVLDKNTKGYDKTVKAFGRLILDVDGNIDRARLRAIVTEDKDKLKLLESIIHPEVIEKTLEIINQGEGKYLLDVPLLFESKMDKICDYVVFVNVMEKIRIQRLKQRNTMPVKDADKLKENTWDASKKIALSDAVIDNSSTLENTKHQVEELIKIL